MLAALMKWMERMDDYLSPHTYYAGGIKIK